MQSVVHERVARFFGIMVLLGMNVSVVSFFVLWMIADHAAIKRVETSTGVYFEELMPNSNLLWIAAHSSLFMVLAADVLALVITAMWRRQTVSSTR